MINSLIIVGILLISYLSAQAEFTSLYTMNGGAGDGYIPDGNLVYDGTFLYGTNNNDFFGGYGTIFKIKPDGTGFTKIHQFSGTGDERQPNGLLLIGSTLYGIANKNFGNGIIYKINTDGTGYSVILQFDGLNYGKNPASKLIYYNSQLYGVTFLGGANDTGLIFKLNTDGSGFTKIHEATGFLTEGINYVDFTMIGSTIYGIGAFGGACGCGNGGTLFKINSDGTGYQTLVDFNTASPAVGTYPGLITIIDNKIFGITGAGLSNNAGALFNVNTNGTSLAKIVEKGGSNPLIDYITGYDNNGTYVVIGNATGGNYGQGYFFWMNADGSNYNIMNQTQTIDNGIFRGEMLLLDNVVFGNLSNGGAVAGEIYKFILPSTPSISTLSVEEITTSSFIGKANIISNNFASISSSGFVWATSPNPTINSNSGKTIGNDTLGNFTQSISKIFSNTTYYIRAYATNYVGTAYGNQIIVSTEKTEEDYAPNNGDGNGDGILDSRQSDVHSYIDTRTKSYVTVECLDDYEILDIEQISPIGESNKYRHLFNLLKFKISASKTTMKIYYHTLNSTNSLIFRKLNEHNEYFTFQNVDYEIEVIDGVNTVVIILGLKDGQVGDYDGVINGEIIDPGGPAILVGALIPTFSEWVRIIALCGFLLVGAWWVKKVV